MVSVPDGKHLGRGRYERVGRKKKGHKRQNNPKKTDYDNQTLGQDFFKKRQQGKDDMRNNAETFDADSLKGRWDEGTTRIVHGVSVTKTRYGGEMWEKPQYRCEYKGYSCRIFYEGVAFYLPCWMYRGYGGVGRQGCFKNPMEAILDFKMRAEGGFQKISHRREFDAETFSKDKVVCIKCGIPSGFPHQLHELPSQVAGKHKYACRNCYNEVNDLNAETFEADSNNCFICSKPANNERFIGPRFEFTKEGDVLLCNEHTNLFDFGNFVNGNILAWTHPNGTKYVQGRLKGAESHRDSKGRFTEKPVLTGSVIGGLALGLMYFMGRK